MMPTVACAYFFGMHGMLIVRNLLWFLPVVLKTGLKVMLLGCDGVAV